jgi:choline monooxygenase
MNELLNRLAEATSKDFEQASSMPPRIYSSAEVLDHEIENIFKKEWICIGRTSEIPEKGDYLSADILDQPVFAIRQDDQSIKVFANVCAHRCAKLLDGCGKTNQIICPYHAWSYKSDGQLIAAPYMDKTVDFKVEDYRLKEVHWEIWQGFIYVSLNENAEPVSSRLSEFEKIIEQYQVENYVHGFSCDVIWPANWKCFVENYMDAYHIFKVHKETFGKYGSVTDITTMHEGNDYFTYHLVDVGSIAEYQHDAAVGVAHPDNDHMDEFWRRQTLLGCVFPAHTMQLQPDMLWYVCVQPHGVDQFRMRWTVSFPPEVLASQDNPQKYIDNNREFLTAVNAEDEGVIRKVYQGSKSDLATPGPYAYFERNVFHFGQYLSRMLCACANTD